MRYRKTKMLRVAFLMGPKFPYTSPCLVTEEEKTQFEKPISPAEIQNQHFLNIKKMRYDLEDSFVKHFLHFDTWCVYMFSFIKR